MSLGAQTKASGSPAAGEADGGDPGATVSGAAGRLFGRITVLPALLAMGWLFAGLPLLLLGAFRPGFMLLASVPIMAVLVYAGFRFVPGRWPEARRAGARDAGGTPWWSVIGLLVVAIAFGVDQTIFHSQFVIVTRDPGSYIQFSAWISGHGSLPISQDSAAFGGTTNLLSFASPAFFQVGSTIVPQFMAGLPMVLSAGFWLGGVTAAVAMAPILGACAILTFGGLVGRLVGPRWAPLAALALALALPMEFTSRSTYSEPLAAILFLGGLCLVIDCLKVDTRLGQRVLAGLAGLALGLTFLVRLDGASDILPVIPYCGLLVIGRYRQALTMTIGFLLGIAYGIVDGVVLSWPYLQVNKTSVDPLAIILGALIILTIITTVVIRLMARRRRRRGRDPRQVSWRRLGTPAAVLTGLVMIGFFVRPYVQLARGAGTSSFQSTIAASQLALNQPIDPSRLYYEISLRWVFWYIGVPAVILGTVGAAILIRRSLQTRGMPEWVLPLAVFSWAIVSTLYRPAITPDQPWASRRLVPAVLPGFILLALWAVRWVSDWLQQRRAAGPALASRAEATGAGVSPEPGGATLVSPARPARFRFLQARPVQGIVLACCALALLLPAIFTTFGISVHSGGPAGIRLTANGLGTTTTYQGEIGAVEGLCKALPADSSVVFINGGPAKIAGQLVEAVRGMCGRPAAIMVGTDTAQIQQVLAGIRRARRQPVLVADFPEQLTPFGGTPRHVVDLNTMVDAGVLTSPPYQNRTFSVSAWMSEPPP
jgi:hypothetical protein